MGRGVLLDLARHAGASGRPLDPAVRSEVDAAQLDACATAQGVTLETGDVLLLRFGVDATVVAGGLAAGPGLFSGGLDCPGLAQSEATLRWLWDRHVAAVGADNMAVEVTPSPDHERRLHPRLLGLLGISLAELLDLRELSDACADSGRWSFLFVAKPWRFRGALGSPANAVAIL